MVPSRWLRLASVGTSVASGTGDTYLARLNVGIASTGSSVVVMNNAGASITGGFTSTSKSQVIAKIDTAATTGRTFDFGDLLIENGMVVFCTGSALGNPDVTISYR